MSERSLRVVIVDDEPHAREGLRMLLLDREGIEVVAVCADGPSAVNAVREHAPDLVFLDVEMPEMNGFQVLEALAADGPPRVIFVTAHAEFAIPAFDVRAVDYLLKPHREARLDLALERARDRIRGEDALSQLADDVAVTAATNASTPAKRSHFVVQLADRRVIVSAADVDWIEASSYYAVLHVGEATHLVRTPLDRLEAELDPTQFLRVHRRAIVRFDRVREVRREGGSARTLLLPGGMAIAVSRSRSANVERWLKRLTDPAKDAP